MEIFKKNKFYYLGIIALFCFYVYLNFHGLGNKELQGDEASPLIAVIPAMKFFQYPQWLVSIFLYGHAPLRGLVEIPFLYVFGLREFWLYFPNVLASLGLFWAVFYVLNKIFDKEVAFISVALLTVNGSIILQRMIMGVGFFLLFTTIMFYHFHNFLQQKKINSLRLSLVFLFLAILTYEEAIIFIPIMIFWLIKKSYFQSQAVLRQFLLFIFSVVTFLTIWLFVSFIAYKMELIDSLWNFGFWRIITRSTNGFLLNPFYYFQSINTYNSLALTWLITCGLLLSAFRKSNWLIWSFLLPPLIYFSILKNPTVHLFNYFNFIIILAGVGFASLTRALKIIFYPSLIIILVINLVFLNKEIFIINLQSKISWGGIYHKGLKSTAYSVRKNTDICDKIYTDIEGYVFRIYFGRRYTNNLNDAKIVVLEKDLQVDINKEKPFDQEYSSFVNFMPYLTCKN